MIFMERRKRVRKSRTEEFIVYLPLQVGYSGRGDIERLGITRAGSNRKALANHVANVVPEEEIGLLVDHLDNLARSEGFSGAEAYAFNVPDVSPADGRVFAPGERREAMEIALAEEIAKARGSDPGKCIGLAHKFLDIYFERKMEYAREFQRAG
jgi:hypothetical protein